MAERVTSSRPNRSNRGEKQRRPSAIACATAVEESAARVQSQLQMRVCVRIPVIQLQRVAEIGFASIDTNVRGSNPKCPMHEHVHSDT